MVLYRPVGEKELELIRDAGWLAFPPRLRHQPIFYPVLEEEYAVQIARDWNTKDAASGYAGHVLRFEIDTEYSAQFAVSVVGSSNHRELWIPAEQLQEFNRHLSGPIELIASFRREH